MFEVKTESHFSAAHHLLNYEGECEHQHGHNWKVEVFARGENLDMAGILIDFKILKKEVKEVLELLDENKFDFIVNNNGTLEDLFNTLKGIIFAVSLIICVLGVLYCTGIDEMLKSLLPGFFKDGFLKMTWPLDLPITLTVIIGILLINL